MTILTNHEYQYCELKNSQYASYFEEDTKLESIYVLQAESAKSFWKHNISLNGNSYFKLRDDDWLVSRKKLIGTINYNWENINDSLEKLQIASYKWSEEKIVYFCRNNINIFFMEYGVFKRCFNDFLAYEKDGSILYECDSNSAFIFTSLGKLFFSCKD